MHAVSTKRIADISHFIFRTLPSVRRQLLYKVLICELFQEPLGERNNNKVWETSKIFDNIAPDYFIVKNFYIFAELNFAVHRLEQISREFNSRLNERNLNFPF